MERINWEALDRVAALCELERGFLQDKTDGVKGMSNLSEVYVPGEGDNPDVFIIGEAPGAQEELLRRPFVGPSGRVMRDLMAIAGLYAHIPRDGKPHVINNSHGLENCWLTNVVKFRPPRNRKPTPLEIKGFRPWLRDEWDAVGQPRVIVPVGGTALHAVTGKPQSILVAAGKLHKARSREGIDLCVWPMVHPSYGIRGGPSVQAILEKDWETFADWMKRARRFGWLDRNRI